jgi:hypothetical protein
MAGNLVKVADLGSAPQAALIENGTILIAAEKRIVALNSSYQARVLFENTDMGLLFPNSIAEDAAGNVFVGMRFFVLQLRQNPDSTYASTWYVPDSCTKTRIEGFQCVCTSRKGA